MKGKLSLCFFLVLITLSCNNVEQSNINLGKDTEQIALVDYVNPLMGTDSKFSFFPQNQYGFMNGRSTITQLLEALNYWSMSLNNGTGVDAVYLDIQKAFDSVPH